MKERSASWSPPTGSFWMITSTLTPRVGQRLEDAAGDAGGSSRTPVRVTRASLSEWVTAVTKGFSMVSSSETTRVPGPSSKLLRQWIRTPWLRAYSTERSCSTPAPEADISSISSKETIGSLRAVGTIRGSGAEDAGDVGVDLADAGIERRREGNRGGVGAAAAERGDVAAVGRDP
ncbi:MAG: hypothetical protein R2725_06110 [Solirubrobacterales bacterium]